jgi:hypothetical protein
LRFCDSDLFGLALLATVFLERLQPEYFIAIG